MENQISLPSVVSSEPFTPFAVPELRTCVYRYERRAGALGYTNVNDEVGLAGYSDYSVEEYLEDQARFDRRKLVAKANDTFLFDDGSVQRLQEGRAPMSENGLRDLGFVC